MNLFVRSQVGLLGESLITLVAFEWSLSGMCSLVPVQISYSGKRFPTILMIALEGLYASMNPLVNDEIVLLSEAFLAVLATERIAVLLAVRPFVFVQIALRCEVLFASIAAEPLFYILLCEMRSLVDLQVTYSGKSLRTLVAQVAVVT